VGCAFSQAVDAVGGVVLLHGRGERLRTDPIKIERAPTSVAFGPNDTCAAGHWSGVVVLDVNPSSWKAKLAGIVNRNFTWAEWRQFFPDADTPYRRTIRSCPLPRDLPDAEQQKAVAWEESHK
jgi:hypothetical protein